MITSAIQQIVNTDRTELKDFFSEVDKLHKTDEAVTAKIANNPALAKALTDPNLTPTQKQQLATELVSSVMVELGYTQAVDIKLVADSQDNRKGHYGEDNNIYLNDANLNNTKDLATTLGHETSHAIDNQDPSINTNPQTTQVKQTMKSMPKTMETTLAIMLNSPQKNYGDGNLADSNNKTRQHTSRNTEKQNLVNNNNQDYAGIDKSKGKDFVVTGTLTAAAIYAAIVGDGNPVDGLETIGQGNDPLTKVIAQGSQAAIELSYEHFPKATENPRPYCQSGHPSRQWFRCNC
ncbi:hypothetical protein BSPWISOXPB_6198 [uncultured Gammaproteobacteria bacterium]|nr:hypothetical protein BSPWISOXPB_6198 [uncultured Gammaproteobacteria bacterium]